MKYRYGVFDVNGFDGDAIYPKCSASSSPICSDAMNIEENRQSTIAESFNRYMPTKQNQLCDRISRMDIILRNSDFNNTIRNQNLINPVFNYVRKMTTRYSVIVDDHIDIKVRDSYLFLKDALRKWLEKDLIREGTEVGIFPQNDDTSREGGSNEILDISNEIYRGKIRSNLPWHITTNGATTSKCNIKKRIMESIGKLSEKHQAMNQIILIAPGMYKCSEEVIEEIVSAANEAGIKIVTVNYPAIGVNRIPLDELARKTGGEAFTVFERKRNEEQSLVTTYFELTNVFMEISRIYHHGDVSELPVEIYR